MTAHEITLAMLAAKGVQEPISKASRDLEGAVRSSLQNHRGTLVEAKGSPMGWSMTRP
jgi:hypothetical protein